ncbi:MAG TPA: SDR family oxidoreductase [Candidatus Eisenbacteria bacterium]|nr:SDR family oxidoreductase [Candidatus Eisenbacteria bacterium]
MSQRLVHRFAIVTGASRGLGRAVADAFVAEGATVVRAARSQGVDVSDPDQVGRLFRDMRHLDVLVQCAGILTPRKNVWEVTPEEWRTSTAVNLDGVFLCMREALRIMIRQKYGLIVNVGSGVSNRPAPSWGPYATAKWGVEGLTKLAAEEAREYGVRIVSVNPGRMRTEMRAAAYPDEDPLTLKTPEDTARFFVDLAAGDIPFTSGDLLQVERK